MLSTLLRALAVSFEEADKISFWIRKINKLITITKVKDAVKVAVTAVVTVDVVTIETMATTLLLTKRSDYHDLL